MGMAAASMKSAEMMAVIRKKSGLFMALGIVLVIVGIIAMIFPFYSTVFFVVLMGVLLVIAGVVGIIVAIATRKAGGAGWKAALGILALIFGILILIPSFLPYTIATITFLIATWLLIDGIMALVLSIASRWPGWAISLIGGILSIVLGILIFVGWPGTAFWIIGLFAGIGLLFSGFSFIAVAAAVRRVTTEAGAKPTA